MQLLYVGLPVLVVGALDRDISDVECLQFPAVYMDGIAGKYINNKQFLRWFLAAVAEAAALCFIPMQALPFADLDGTRWVSLPAASAHVGPGPWVGWVAPCKRRLLCR